ncbi:MAG: hypothetical protein AVDCRST_MAG66-2094, partial [uncultured Pseudonocardia sp.]
GADRHRVGGAGPPLPLVELGRPHPVRVRRGRARPPRRAARAAHRGRPARRLLDRRRAARADGGGAVGREVRRSGRRRCHDRRVPGARRRPGARRPRPGRAARPARARAGRTRVLRPLPGAHPGVRAVLAGPGLRARAGRRVRRAPGRRGRRRTHLSAGRCRVPL